MQNHIKFVFSFGKTNISISIECKSPLHSILSIYISYLVEFSLISTQDHLFVPVSQQTLAKRVTRLYVIKLLLPIRALTVEILSYLKFVLLVTVVPVKRV